MPCHSSIQVATFPIDCFHCSSPTKTRPCYSRRIILQPHCNSTRGKQGSSTLEHLMLACPTGMYLTHGRSGKVPNMVLTPLPLWRGWRAGSERRREGVQPRSSVAVGRDTLGWSRESLPSPASSPAFKSHQPPTTAFCRAGVDDNAVDDP